MINLDYTAVLESIVQATLNFIVVSAITNGSQQRTIADMKTDFGICERRSF